MAMAIKCHSNLVALTFSQKEPNQTRLVFTDQAGHWYNADGKSAHVIIGKTGLERNTTVGDARKLGLYPSVTSVLAAMAKPQLANWQMEQVLLASINIAREPDESLESYAKRVIKASKEQTTKAAEHGTRMHEEMEKILMGQETSKDERMAPYIKTFKEWAAENVTKTYWCERALVGAGYAGRCDALVDLRGVGTCIIDLKNRKVNDRYEPFFETDVAQLAAYRMALGDTSVGCVSIVLAANDPEKIVTRVWDEREICEAYQAFSALLKVWAWVKQYTPPGMKL